MNHLLVLSLLACLVCFVPVNGLCELMNICSNSIFEFKGYTVNSFYVIENSFELDKLDDLLIADDLDSIFERCTKSEQEVKKLKEQKDDHNRIMKLIWRETFIDSADVKTLRSEQQIIMNTYNFFRDWKTRIDSTDKFAYEKITTPLLNAFGFFNPLISLKSNQLSKTLFRREFEESYNGIVTQLKGQVQGLILSNIYGNLDYYYEGGFVQMKKFNILIDKSRVDYEILVPAFRRGSIEDTNCKEAKDLPPFYNKTL